VTTSRLHDFDQPRPQQARGRELLDNGLPVNLPERRSSCLIRYQRVK